MATKQFHISAVLSVVTGILLCPFDHIFQILEFMTGYKIYRYMLPESVEFCKSYLVKDMPWLEQIDATELNLDNWKEWLETQIAQHGEFHEIATISEDAVERELGKFQLKGYFISPNVK